MIEHQLIDRRPHAVGVLSIADTFQAHGRLGALTGAAGKATSMRSDR